MCIRDRSKYYVYSHLLRWPPTLQALEPPLIGSHEELYIICKAEMKLGDIDVNKVKTQTTRIFFNTTAVFEAQCSIVSIVYVFNLRIPLLWNCA